MKILHTEDIPWEKIKNIIFDWGGVIVNINYDATVKAFIDLGVIDFNNYFTQQLQNQSFKKYEIGEISSAEIKEDVRNLSEVNFTNGEFDAAWCAMLLDSPPERIEQIKEISKQYKTYLLSNTNEIHADWYIKGKYKNAGIDFRGIFKKAYLSHEIGLRKPNKEIFEYVLRENDLRAEETLFIDDTEMHVDGAAKVGINAFFLRDGMDIIQLFKSISVEKEG